VRIAIALAVLGTIAALGTAASLRYGVRGRRLTAWLVVLAVVPFNLPPVVAPKIVDLEAQAIMCLRALNAAQLIYTSSHDGRYATNLEELDLGCARQPVNPRAHRIELFSNGDSYAAIAVPQDQPRQRATSFRSFCVSAVSTIFQTPGGVTPEVDAGRCRDTTRPIQ
jgi:hypothetical protein